MSPTNQTVTESEITADGENSNLRLTTEGEEGTTDGSINGKTSRFPKANRIQRAIEAH